MNGVSPLCGNCIFRAICGRVGRLHMQRKTYAGDEMVAADKHLISCFIQGIFCNSSSANLSFTNNNLQIPQFSKDINFISKTKRLC